MRDMQTSRAIGLVCLAAILSAVRCEGAYWGGERDVAVGNWDTAAEWASLQGGFDDTKPTIGADNGLAFVGSTETNWWSGPLPGATPLATVTVSTDNSCVLLRVGEGGNGAATGTVYFTHAGTFYTWYPEVYGNGDAGSRGAAHHTGAGKNEMRDGVLSLGGSVGTVGIYNLSNANASVVVGVVSERSLYAGARGNGTFNHYAGLCDIEENLYVGGDTSTAFSAVGVYNLSSGTCDVDNAVFVGLGGQGTVHQTGGRFEATTDPSYNNLNVGLENGRGTYNLTGGTLAIDRYNYLTVQTKIRLGTGAGGRGEFHLGDATGRGSIVERGTGNPIAFNVRCVTNASGVFRGWSDDGGGSRPQLPGHLTNNGQVIADGYGQPRSLDLSNFSKAETGTNTLWWYPPVSHPDVFDNTTSNGWFAVNKGKLILPGLLVSAAGTYNWGERPGDSTIDAVNSARIRFNDFNGSGRLDGSLLAPDRSDVPASRLSLISVHDLALNGGASSSDFNLTIRYDDAAAGPRESALKLFHYTGGRWTDTGASLDQGNHRITASNLTAFGEFGVGFTRPGGPVIRLK